MNETPLVSIVIGFYNAGKFIMEAVESVMNQSLDDWQLLLVDDGSSDASSDIAQYFSQQHPGKIHYLEHKDHCNRGVCVSRNLGISKAAGRFIAILDADDVWQPHKLAQQTAILQAHPEAGMVFGASRYWNSWTGAEADKNSDYIPRLGVTADTLYEPPALLKLCHPLGRVTAPCPSDLLLRHEIVEAVNGFEEKFTGIYQLYEDQAFLAKVYLSAPVFVSSSTWTGYRLHPDSCCYRVASSGDEPLARMFYLQWLKDYLHTNQIEDVSIHKALNTALLLQRHPLLNQLVNLPRTATTQGKKLIRRLQHVSRIK
jgi:glycosyltransferase involved in cell wall biosynthesis